MSKDWEPYIAHISPWPSDDSFYWFALDPYDKKIGAIEDVLIAITNSANKNLVLFRAIGCLRRGLKPAGT